MHVNIQHRFNPALGKEGLYYRLKESYRDVRGNVHSLIVLNVGFVPELDANQMRRIAYALTDRFKNRNSQRLFGDDLSILTEQERGYAEHFWQRMIDERMIDRFNSREAVARKESERYIDIDTTEHTDAREVGAEWLCKQTIDRLGLEDFLRHQGWSETMIHTALSSLIVRTVYCSSELASLRIMRENSAACELYSGTPDWVPGFNSLYKITDKLLEIKPQLERFLCNRVDTLFNLQNRIILFDLTNFFFEGSKRNSAKAKFGRSKERRSDCKLLVLALSINTDGFIRYSDILEGNTADPKSLPDMVERLIVKNGVTSAEKTLVVIDAGIATEDNLKLLKERNFNYLCVSRTKLKDYKLADDGRSATVYDNRKQPITLRQVDTGEDSDYYLEVTSPSKAMTEASMNRQWRERFEQQMQSVNESIVRKGGIKSYEKVIERVGRVIQQYPSIAKYYDIVYERDIDNPERMKHVKWSVKDLTGIESGHGVYFLRTNVQTLDERTTWDYYNLIREIETTNRQLKTDLSLRPIYHQKDNRSDAHLFFGLLAYWVVNTIRYELKQNGINCYWTEIVRRMSTQKLVTTEGINPLGDKVELRQCSRPKKSAVEIYRALNYKEAPFKKIKICRTQPPPD